MHCIVHRDADGHGGEQQAEVVQVHAQGAGRAQDQDDGKQIGDHRQHTHLKGAKGQAQDGGDKNESQQVALDLALGDVVAHFQPQQADAGNLYPRPGRRVGLQVVLQLPYQAAYGGGVHHVHPQLEGGALVVAAHVVLQFVAP